MTRDPVVLVGNAITLTGALHLALGVVTFAEPLREMLGDGLVNSMRGLPHRQAALWYFVAGGFLLTSGLTTRWVRRTTGTAPIPLAWGLVGTAAVGAAVAPVSGFWLVLVEGILLLVAGHRSVARPAASHV